MGSYTHSLEDGLELDLNIPVNLQGKGLGSQIFADAMQTTNATKFTGPWIESAAYEGGASTNLKQFWDARRAGQSEVDAAFSTWSGGMARKYGFKNVKVTYINNGKGVQAVFTK